MPGDKEKNVHETNITAVASFTRQDIGKNENVITTIISPFTSHEVKLTGDVDEALKFALDHSDAQVVLTPERDRKLLWKIDLHLMPILCLLYCFQFMDKLSNSYASVLGLRTDLSMQGDMYSWTGSAFYIGYLVFEFPASRLLQKFPVAKTLSIFIILWGIILMLHATPQYPGFIALRTILGMLESSVTPANLLITGSFYRKEEVFLRVALWFSSNGIGTMLGSGAIAHSLVQYEDSYSIAPWKLTFIITGALTVVIGFIFMFHVPDTPANAWFLNEEEKMLVVERIRANQQGFGNKHFKMHQFKEAMFDIKTWLIALFAFASNIPNGGITNFGSILLTEDLGYSVPEGLLMQIPAGAVEFVGCSLLAFAASYVAKKRLFWAMVGTVIAVVGECFLAFSNNHKLQLAGYILYSIAPVGFICLLSIISSNVAGHTKKVTTNAIYLVSYCVGNLIGPQTFLEREAPNYKTAKICIAAFGVFSIAILGAIWFVYWFDNRSRDRMSSDAAEDFALIDNHEFADLTDKENPLFRYEL
ncbi:allantoate permease [Scheffersomyces stipitis CBS 6054]|uniref:Allantoate permease n=1 Tax=Scheffersomyces stipitis (strain ATCC 58785 / CBS 6054 / NBRC 10063 / NRRL Y-11545) TaxID=322104 RepID=A3LNX0_PICST|nr:allantoate permease [Scheffersomyces stipitis CBS 6054]ABN64395.1 allantoate permease [Scheffersomyces stipitis CBS 6054]